MATSNIRKIIVVGAAGVALAAAGIVPAYALAAPGNRSGHVPSGLRRAGASHFGTVAAVSGSAITLSGKDGVTYTVDTQDAKIIKAGNPASLAAVAVGDPIAVVGPLAADTITARVVVDGPVAHVRRFGGIMGGTISSISPDGTVTLTPKSHAGKPARPAITFETNASTVVSRKGQSVPLNSLAVGSEIIVSGARGATGTLVASKILIRTP